MGEATEIAVPEPVSGKIAELVREMLVHLGENPDREGLRRTPERFEKALRFLTSGYRQDPDKLLNGAMFNVCYDEMVVVKDIELYSLCEHHLLPFFGKCHVAYIPKKKVVGLSKVARLVNMYARRLQIQERLTSQIATAIQEKLDPAGVGVIIEARHLCMVMRGVEKQNSTTTTSAMLGDFRENKQTRDEFLALALRRAEEARDGWFPRFDIPDCVIEEIDPVEAGNAPLAYYRPPAAGGLRPEPEPDVPGLASALRLGQQLPGIRVQVVRRGPAGGTPRTRRRPPRSG